MRQRSPNLSNKTLTGLIFIAILTQWSPLSNAMPPPPNEIEQQKAALEKVEKSSFDTFKLNYQVLSETPGTPIKIYIAPTSLEFQKRWLRERRTDLTKSYLENTAERYQSVFDQEMKQAFSKKTEFQIVEDANEALWLITPAVSDLIIHGPDVGIGKTTYVQNAGEAKLTVHINNASGNEVAFVEDRRETRQRGLVKPEKTSRIFNQRDFRYLFDNWSDSLAKALANSLNGN